MIQNTGIWKNSFGVENKTNSNIQRLTVSLEGLRNKATHLTSKISEALPHLTIHDITHLDALWEVADIIVGNDFSLNPLEAYVFGSAVLLHDAALCFQAYTGVSMVYVRLLNGEMPMQDSLVYPTMCIIFTTRPTLRH